MNSDSVKNVKSVKSVTGFDVFDAFDALLDPRLLFATDPHAPSSPLRSCVFRMAHQLLSCPSRFETLDFDLFVDEDLRDEPTLHAGRIPGGSR